MPTEQISEFVQILKHAWKNEQQVLICGNGGSGSLASHLACDLQKGLGCLTDRKFKAMAITDSLPLLTAWANDTDYSNIFAEQVSTWAKPGDVLVAISGSGNSPNIIRALEAAKLAGVKTVGVTGMGGGKLAGLADIAIIVPSNNMQQIEDVHLVITHLVYTCLHREIGECE